jgi:hypothetical protein
MKTKLFAAALAALTLATAGAASAQDFGRGRGGEQGRYERGDWQNRGAITVRKDGRVMTFDRRDRMFYRLLDRPFGFRPGMTYAYTDRCNRNGCVAFVFDGRHRRPVDRIFAPHLRDARGYAWRENGGFDRGYARFGAYDRDDRGWNNEDDRSFREGRDRGDWDGDGRRDSDRDGQLDGGRRDGQGRDFRRDGQRN